MPMPSPYQIALSCDEQAVLTTRARSVRGSYRDRLRAAIVLAAAAGLAQAHVETLPLASAAEAHERLENHSVNGRLVLHP